MNPRRTALGSAYISYEEPGPPRSPARSKEALAHVAGLEVRSQGAADGAAEEADAAGDGDAVAAGAVSVAARLVEESAGFLEHQLQLHELGVAPSELVRVDGDLTELELERLQLRLELVQLVRLRAIRRGHRHETSFMDLLGEVPELAQHLVAPLHLVGVRPLKRAAVGVEISKLHEADVAEVRDRVVRSLRGDDELHQLHRLGAKELHGARVPTKGHAPAARPRCDLCERIPRI